MKIKQSPEEFIVEEINTSGISSISYPLAQKIFDRIPKKKGKYLHCDLVKRNYTTERAINAVSRSLGISRKRISYAGKKDKKALTSQRISIRDGEKKILKIKDIQLKNFSYRPKMVKMGYLIGNRFTIIIRDIDVKGKANSIEKFVKNSKHGVKNYFGAQRFGIRGNNHIVGKRILQGKYESAIKSFLTDSNNERKDIKNSRDWLNRNWGDWKGGLKAFPKILGLERNVLEYLERSDGNFLKAIKKMPKMISLLFVHAYQSHIFNCCLEHDDESEELPLVGYETKMNGILRDVLNEEEMRPSDFRVKDIPRLSSRGSIRKTKFFPIDFRVIRATDSSIALRFGLESGIYATVLLNELARYIGDFVEN